ncbi:hypothetical protein NDK47_18665 [Brevibacillus ruminantium]|uniref:Uncharacterized protein n=1 Tax=Brevibacillus ruminantium TaxID=2950604 RepID=A0ABY4WAH8_9BACL|nr:hypothetical protein [Brevibacillus ruminantium]USG64167.1 hypothetical protein NDK47_18665 [Brevibacillus ruminantium]
MIRETVDESKENNRNERGIEVKAWLFVGNIGKYRKYIPGLTNMSKKDERYEK